MVTTNRSEERILKLCPWRAAMPGLQCHNQSIRGEDTETGITLASWPPAESHNQSIRGEDTETVAKAQYAVEFCFVTTNRSEERILKPIDVIAQCACIVSHNQSICGLAVRYGHNQSIRGEDTETFGRVQSAGSPTCHNQSIRGEDTETLQTTRRQPPAQPSQPIDPRRGY